MIRLSPRLSAAASLIDGGGTLADIGTDHAYLPVYLLQRGVIERAVACDIGAGPLANAKKTVEAQGGDLCIDLRLSDGLAALQPHEADEIVICGMGGNMIEDILLGAPWVRSAGVHLVLQPMSHAEDVRRYLCENGFAVEKELCVCEDRKVYLTIGARWTGETREWSEGYCYFGDLPKTDAPSVLWAQKQYRRVKKRVEALRASGMHPEEAQTLSDVMEYYHCNQREI